MDFGRPREGFRFVFNGWKVNTQPDAMSQGKYALAINVRAYSDVSTRTRPGIAALYSLGGQYPTDINTYQPLVFGSLATDNPVRTLSRGADDTIYLDGNGATTGVLVGTLAGAGVSYGASMIPFRPNESTVPWMYVANGFDYQKFSAPDLGGTTVMQQKVGIAEPQIQPEAMLWDNAGLGCSPMYEQHGTPALTAGGTAGTITSSSRISDTVVASFTDPIYALAGSPALGNPVPVTLQVGSSVAYSKYMMLFVTHSGDSTLARVIDVFPPLSGSIPIEQIYYFSGTTGRCVLSPAQIGSDTLPDQSIYSTTFISGLRRGALIKIGTEVCMVWSVTTGPNGAIAIETSTTSNHTTADALTGVSAIQMMLSSANYTGYTLTSPSDSFAVTTGIGTATGVPVITFASSGNAYQSDDYLHLSVYIDNPTNLVEMKFLLDVGDGSFSQNFFYYTIRQADLAQAINNAVTQLAIAQTVAQRAIIDEEEAIAAANEGETFSGAQSATGSNQWTEIFFPISQLTRVGNDDTKSLQTLTKFQLLINCSANVNVQVGGIYISGGSQVDVGDVGAPLRYRFIGYSSTTGVRSNPSPETRYGVSPRRGQVLVYIPNGATPYDPQIDTWWIYRYGGSITTWRFVGQVSVNPVLGSIPLFFDNFDDAAISAGDELQFDNFEPWPSVDDPNNSLLVSFAGTVAVVSSPDEDITSYLPGTLVRFTASENVYTLRTRPTLISGANFLLQFDECIQPSGPNCIIQEPLIANQFLPYMWGPDVNGTVFACGDTLRPGNIYFSKSNAPDAAPDTYNEELCPPSEPLLGGEIIDGISFVASSSRWWGLYFQQGNDAQRYAFVQQPFQRGLAAPFGHCNDGKNIYWWAPDGIWSSSEGSLTDADLSTLFPKDGVIGKAYSYNGVTINPPDYQQCSKFRLEYCNGYLYALYAPIGGGPYVTLVCDLKRKAWSVDIYDNMYMVSALHTIPQKVAEPGFITIPYQPSAKLLVGGTINVVLAQGQIYQQQDLHNDDTTMIRGILATNEFDGGDIRAVKQWGDLFLDVRPIASAIGTTGITVTPLSKGAPILGAPIHVAYNASRVRLPYDLSGVIISDFFGLFLRWFDDFTQQTDFTNLYAWQPSWVVQPAYDAGWTTFGSSYGLDGFFHIRQLLVAYVATAPITLAITTYDGMNPPPIILPSTGGQFQKTTFPVGPNKGMLFQFRGTSTAPFQIFEDHSEVWAGQWGRPDAYTIFRNLGGKPVEQGPI